MKFYSLYIFLLLFQFSIGQESIEEVLQKYNKESIPYIYASELNNNKHNTILLDAREYKEYEVSHLKDAIFVGHKTFQLSSIKDKLKQKDQKIVVYCSLGVRSEDIAETLKKEGYTNVFNLYGGIFEWKNKGYNIYTSNNTITENVHVFSEAWSRWLTKGKKVYE